jgi:hypothetical protein
MRGIKEVRRWGVKIKLDIKAREIG